MKRIQELEQRDFLEIGKNELYIPVGGNLMTMQKNKLSDERKSSNEKEDKRSSNGKNSNNGRSSSHGSDGKKASTLGNQTQPGFEREGEEYGRDEDEEIQPDRIQPERPETPTPFFKNLFGSYFTVAAFA